MGGTTIKLCLSFPCCFWCTFYNFKASNSSVLCLILITAVFCFSGLTDEVLWSILRRGCQNLTSLDLSQSPHFLTEFAVLCIGRSPYIFLPQNSFLLKDGNSNCGMQFIVCAKPWYNNLTKVLSQTFWCRIQHPYHRPSHLLHSLLHQSQNKIKHKAMLFKLSCKQSSNVAVRIIWKGSQKMTQLLL
mgnify:CR=1 FL=1